MNASGCILPCFLSNDPLVEPDLWHSNLKVHEPCRFETWGVQSICCRSGTFRWKYLCIYRPCFAVDALGLLSIRITTPQPLGWAWSMLFSRMCHAAGLQLSWAEVFMPGQVWQPRRWFSFQISFTVCWFLTLETQCRSGQRFPCCLLSCRYSMWVGRLGY